MTRALGQDPIVRVRPGKTNSKAESRKPISREIWSLWTSDRQKLAKSPEFRAMRGLVLSTTVKHRSVSFDSLRSG